MCAAIILDGTAIQPPSVVLQINRPSPDQGHRTTEPKIIFLSKAAIELQSKATEDEYVDYETFKRIKKGNGKALEALIDAHLKKAWFISFQLTEHVCRGAPLLIKAWKASLEQIISAQTAPKEDFREILHSNLLKLYLIGVEDDPEFESLPVPQVAKKYQQFVAETELLPNNLKPAYLMNVYGNLSTARLAQILGIPTESVADSVKQAAENITKASGALRRDKQAAKIQLSAEFRNPSDSGFEDIVIPAYLSTALIHEINHLLNKPVIQNRKEQNAMTTKTNNIRAKGSTKAVSKRSNKKAKIIVISAVVLSVVILGVIFIPKLVGRNTGKNTSITTYNVETITTGNVDTTINGSGTLSPVSKETLATAKAGTVAAVNYEVGDKVEEGAVIAVIKEENGSETDFTAPYDCILIELPISTEDELAANSQIAMVMGTDGFTMGIAVDELDISTVKVGQEVDFTIDAVDGSYTGRVTAVSYNGSSSGGTTAYQITAQVDYVEGVSPGMSASAEIVIESSGEGLLVPVDAVRTSGDQNYVYLAPSGAAEGTEYEEDQLDVSNLTKVTVETGMSDGSYILIESDELAEGDLIVITKITSTQTGSDSESQGGFGGMSGFPGGGGMDFGDFDFENFDPNNMPPNGEGGFPGGMGGN